jgi:polyhydroxyalkanoate synthesis regulator phasin
MSRIKCITVVLVLIALLLACPGCSKFKSEIEQKQLEQPSAPGFSGDTGKDVAYQDEEKSSTLGDKPGSDGRTSQTGDVPEIRKMIIYTVNVSMTVKNQERACKDLVLMVNESKGYIISENISKSGEYSKMASFTIKVPAESLTPFVDKLSQLGDVTSQNKSGQDVTEEFVDKSARLENMKREEKRYQELFNVAKTVDDMLKVQRELARVRGDIEALEGRLNYLQKNVAMSTVQLTMEERMSHTPKSFWSFGETFDQAKLALKHLFKSLISCSIYFVVVFIPLILIVAIPIWIIIRIIKGMKKKS